MLDHHGSPGQRCDIDDQLFY